MVANTPQTEGSTDSGFKSPHHLIYFLWVTPETPHRCLLIQTHNTAEIVSLFMSLDITANVQSHCPELSPVILSSLCPEQGHHRDAWTSLP